MKTVILCGGRGTRLAEETEYRPKPLVEIGGKPILLRIMQTYSSQGFKEFVLCLGYKGNLIKEYFINLEEMANDFMIDLRNKNKMILTDNNSLEGKVYFADTGLNSMTGARISKIKKYLGGEEDFFLTYGDGLANIDLKKLYAHHKKTDSIVTLTGVNPVYPFGIIEIQDGIVKNFVEKPEMKDVINGGFMVCNKKVFEYLSEEEGCIFEQEPLRRLAGGGKLGVYEHKGFWSCMDTQKHVNELNKLCNEGYPPWERVENDK